MSFRTTSNPGCLGPESDCLRGRPAVPGEMGPCRRACGVGQLSRAYQARVGGPAGSTSFPGGLAVVSEGLRCRPHFQAPLVSSHARGIDQISRGTRVRVRVPAGSISCPWQLGPGSEGRRCRPAVPWDCGQCARARRVDRLPWETRVRVQGPAWSTSSPGRLALVSKSPRSRPAVPRDTVP